MRSSALVLALCAVGALLRAQPPLAFVDVTVIPMDRERVLEHQTVIVAEGRIAAIGPTARTKPPTGATIVDGRGKYLIPGLGDAHAHLSSVGGGPALAERALVLFALNGVTMARSMYTEPHHAAARDRVERGDILGPRLEIVSPPVGGQMTPAAARTAVASFRDAGYRTVKVMPGLTRMTFDTLTAEAKRLGLRLAGHIPVDVGLSAALSSGFHSVEHLDGFLESVIARTGTLTSSDGGFFGLGVLSAVDESQIARLVGEVKASGTSVVPTEYEMELFVSTESGDAMATRPETRYAPPALATQWSKQKDGFVRGVGVTPDRSARYRDVRRRLIRELNAAGVPIVVGSDAFNLFDIPGYGTFAEIETLAAAGLTPFEALRASTVNVARLMGIEQDVGTIAPGKAADLVLLDANPLAGITNVRRQTGVVLRGNWLPRPEIEARLAALAADR